MPLRRASGVQSCLIPPLVWICSCIVERASRFAFISFLCLRIVVAAGGRVIEVHRCCCPGGLLGGLGAWLGGLGGISKRGCGLGWSCCFISFRFLCIEAAAGDHAIEVHRCCCPGGLLGGLRAGRGGLGACVVSIVYALVVQWGGGLLRRWWGISGRRISRWNASTSLLCVEVALGESYSSSGR